MRVTPVSAYMAASNDGKLETLRAKNRPFQGARIRGARLQFDRQVDASELFLTNASP